MRVGVRELRDSLSKHLATVRAGHAITVTDHGRAIARIVPVDGPTTLERMIAEGKVTPARNQRQPRLAPVQTNGSISDLIDLQRR